MKTRIIGSIIILGIIVLALIINGQRSESNNGNDAPSSNVETPPVNLNNP
jgi:cell division septation protein DedD